MDYKFIYVIPQKEQTFISHVFIESVKQRAVYTIIYRNVNAEQMFPLDLLSPVYDMTL